MRTRCTTVLAIAILGIAACSAESLAQLALLEDQNGPEADFRGVSLPSNRTDSRGIRRVRERIAKGEFAAAIRYLDEVLERTEDSFLVAGSSGKYVGLKETAWNIIRDLPLAGREAYETTFGPVARRLLRQAVGDGDYVGLKQLTRRYFHTPAGYEAALLLAGHEADLSRHLAAALIYQQLLDSPAAVARFQPQLSIQAALSWLALGNERRAEQILLELSSASERKLRVGGRDVRLDFSGPNWPERLLEVTGVPVVSDLASERQWLTSGGNPQRSGQTEGGLPHMRVDWQVRLLAHPALESAHQEISAGRAQQRQPLIPASAPLAVGNSLITRSAHNLIAIDFTTGKRVWQVQPQRFPAFARLTNGTSGEGDDVQVDPARAFSQRIWEDYLYNTISSDGQRVYIIRDLRPPATKRYEAWQAQFLRDASVDTLSAGTNRLCAYDIETQGKLVWEVDGAAGRDEMKEAFFLGAPLAVGRSLYALVEIQSEKAIYLVALDAQSGKLQWRQHLANLERGILVDPSRRLQAAIPSYDAGVLVCPTGVGVVVGVDLVKHGLAWAYRYETIRNLPQRQRRAPNRSAGNPLLAGTQWIDVAATIVSGRVLLAPPESDALHCLDLATGELQWRKPRKEGLFLAGVNENNVLVVGQTGLRALRLDDGQPAWKGAVLDFPEDSYPTGRGFFSHGRYYIPLSTAEVVSIDAQDGTVVGRARARDGRPLGNLVCHRGTVLSQSGKFLDRFGQLDVLRDESLRRRALNPKDHEALRTLGEIAFNDNQLTEAIDLLQSAYTAEPDDLQTREVLRECLHAALDEDFASFRNRLPLLEEIQGPSEKDELTLLRLQARGLFEVGDVLGSFDVCQTMAQRTDLSFALLQIGRHHQVSLSRWISAQVAAIWAHAQEHQRAEISSRVQDAIAQLSEETGRNNVEQFFNCFGTLELCEPVALKIASLYAGRGNLLAAQQLLVYLTDSQNVAVRGEAVARCSELLHQAGLHSLAAPFDQQLGTSLAGVVCLDGKTGQQVLLERGLAQPSLGESRLDEAGVISRPGGLNWPYGQVDIVSATASREENKRGARASFSEVRLERTDEVLGRCNVFQGRNNGEVLVRDSQGREFFRTTPPLPSSGRYRNSGTAYGVTHGNLLLLSTGQYFIAFDTLASGIEGAPKLLWRKQAVSNLDNWQEYRAPQSRFGTNRPGSQRAPRNERDGRWTGIIGPVTHDSCIMQDQSRLFCVDPVTGELKWQRTDIPAGCDLFGDQQFVFAVERSSRNALVLSTVDGRSLDDVPAPIWSERVASLGRHIIRWRKLANRNFELSSLDASSGKIAWKHDFDQSSKLDIAISRYIAVVDALGRCAVVDAVTGNRVLDVSLQKPTGMTDIHLFAGSDNFVLAVQRTPKATPSTRRVQLLNSFDYIPFDGHIYVFDRETGQPVFTRPATVGQRALMLSQPVDLPVIAFAGNLPRQTSSGSKPFMRLLLLEKASGRSLYDNDKLEISVNHFALHADEQSGNDVVVEMVKKEIRLSFTDRHRPPEPPMLHDIISNRQGNRNGLLGIGQKVLGF